MENTAKRPDKLGGKFKKKICELGLDLGPIDGLHGPLSSKAVRIFLERKARGFFDQDARFNSVRNNPNYALRVSPVNKEDSSTLVTQSSGIIQVPEYVSQCLKFLQSGKVELVAPNLEVVRKINSREILITIQLLRSLSFNHPIKKNLADQTIAFLENVLRDNPQAISFFVTRKGKSTFLKPNVLNLRIPKPTPEYDVVIFGGEVESAVAAIRQAEKGKKVALVVPFHGGRALLGGTSVREGSNMRFFDVPYINKSEGVREAMKILGLTSSNLNAIPDNALGRLFKAVSRCRNIEIIPIASFDSTVAHTEKDRVVTVYAQLANGQILGLKAKTFIDTDPESRLTEKVLGRPNVNTIRQGYGVVFDITGLRPEQLEKIILTHNQELLKKVLEHSGLSFQQALKDPVLNRLITKYLEGAEKLQRKQFDDLIKYSERAWGGGRMLKLLYDIYTYAHHLRNRDTKSSDLVRFRFLGLYGSDVETSDGFNIALHDNSITFNSLTYALPFIPLQYTDRIRNNPRLAFLGLEEKLLTEFLSLLASKQVKVLMPNELYIRSSSADFSQYMRERYKRSDVKQERAELAYANDYRGHYLWHYNTGNISVEFAKKIERQLKPVPGILNWRINAETTKAKKYGNFYSVNKNVFSPEVFGGLRIVANLCAHAAQVPA
ncbi:MAG: hypothetical protein NZO16_00470 [Deltaproteobacteria bacterium]|nr:hypothetical protein [Deltaproteobacteria bacterium]